MIVVFEAVNNIRDYLKESNSILSIQPDNFTEIRFGKDYMDINSRTSLDTYLRYNYNDWAIKCYIIDQHDKYGNNTNFDQYILGELLKRFKVLDQPKEKTVNESLGILGN